MQPGLSAVDFNGVLRLKRRDGLIAAGALSEMATIIEPSRPLRQAVLHSFAAGRKRVLATFCRACGYDERQYEVLPLIRQIIRRLSCRFGERTSTFPVCDQTRRPLYTSLEVLPARPKLAVTRSSCSLVSGAFPGLTRVLHQF